MYRGHNDANLTLLHNELKKLFYHYVMRSVMYEPNRFSDL